MVCLVSFLGLPPRLFLPIEFHSFSATWIVFISSPTVPRLHISRPSAPFSPTAYRRHSYVVVNGRLPLKTRCAVHERIITDPAAVSSDLPLRQVTESISVLAYRVLFTFLTTSRGF